MEAAKEVFLQAFSSVDREDDYEEIVKEPVGGVPGAFLLRNVMTSAKCNEICMGLRSVIKMTIRERQGTTKVGDDGGNDIKDRRKSQHHTPVHADAAHVAPLGSIIRQFLPGVAGPKNTATLATPGYEVSGFLRLYDYEEGEFSTPHFDKSFTQHDKKTGRLLSFSAYSMLVYLNEDFDGGTTTFFQLADDSPALQSKKGNTPERLMTLSKEVGSISVVPKTGDILIFPHGRMTGCHTDPLHEGSVVQKGRKSIVRTDVVFYPKEKRSKGKDGGKKQN